ncbi:MAG TPA: hypothetical protein GX523_14305 [Desulfitobacterium dehalogenans]|uniref:t-SNARE coiled-coil homology domain-containing protein n=1 Tax=Desulfitobacterium dehalogenans TaxID=36854 RepID=A0A7C6Z5R8_9FIRM|nr:hypothetical protein [Desulfitobacterium dehalogenans]
MDQELREILYKILHGQTTMSENMDSLQRDVSSMKGDISALQKDIGSMKGDISALQKDVGSMKGDISSVQKDASDLQSLVTKNTLLLESTQKDIQIIANVQKSHYEQNQREHQEMLTIINTKTNIIELAVRSMSTTLAEIQEDSQSLDEIIGRHARSIETMKRKLAKTL